MLTPTFPVVVNFNTSVLKSIVYDTMGPIWGEKLWLEGFLGFEPEAQTPLFKDPVRAAQ
jgi:hypothetical protein